MPVRRRQVERKPPAPGFITLTLHDTGKPRRFAVAHIVGYQGHATFEGVTTVDDVRSTNAVYDVEGVSVRESCSRIDALIRMARGVAR